MARDLEAKAQWVRRQVLEMSLAAGGGHIAPCYSCTEILVALYYGVLKIYPKNPEWEDRDRFILSKGHAAAALYAILADLGFFPISELANYCQPESRLGGHADRVVPGVELSTGYLGHGLAVGAGIAFTGRRVFVLMGDGECQEGVVWEAAMFAGHHKLNNLTAIIDRNGLQALAPTEEVMGLEPLTAKWHGVGWRVGEVSGHNIPELISALQEKGDVPHMIIAHTIKGKGLPFMEGNPIWHYRIPDEKESVVARQLL